MFYYPFPVFTYVWAQVGLGCEKRVKNKKKNNNKFHSISIFDYIFHLIIGEFIKTFGNEKKQNKSCNNWANHRLHNWTHK